jgi:UDP-2,3-diacylglucosamine pyrophosphatase LpxH
MKVKALIISDVHLGARGVRVDDLMDTLKSYDPEYLFIVGDFIDGWLLKKRFYWLEEYTKIINKILKLSKKCKVIYITGNHDEFLRDVSPITVGNITICDEYIFDNIFITHGDLYDGIVKLKWLGILGSVGYDFAIWLDRGLKKMGMKRSLSKFLKEKVKNAIKFITNFEDQLVYQAKLRGCDTVVCGHIHTPMKKQKGDVLYVNTGDWIENSSYVIISKTGKIKLINEGFKVV